MWSRFMLQTLSHGAMNCMAATVLQSKISSEMCSRLSPHVMHLLQFWQMDLLLPGEIPAMEVTALKSKLRNVQVKGTKHSALVP